jgi:hypothetical protein
MIWPTLLVETLAILSSAICELTCNPLRVSGMILTRKGSAASITAEVNGQTMTEPVIRSASH